MHVSILIMLVFLAEFGLHYFPWRKLLRGCELPRVAAYTLGMLGLMLPFSAWLWSRGETQIMLILWSVIVAGGITVFALYGLDHYLELIMRDIEAAERERMHRGEK